VGKGGRGEATLGEWLEDWRMEIGGGGGGRGDSPDRSEGNRPSHDIQHVQNPISTNAQYGGFNSKKNSVAILSTSAFFHEKSAPTGPFLRNTPVRIGDTGK
jgi:hypothetical protein